MRVLYIDFNTMGHHSVYYGAISSIKSVEPILVLPQKVNKNITKQYEIPFLSRNMSFSQYRHVMSEINKIIEKENPDIVHILSGDMLYRFFGWKLDTIKKPLIVTFHHMEFSFVKKISYRHIYRKIKCGIIHTEFIHKKLKKIGILNVYHIEYPFLEEIKTYDNQILKMQFSIPKKKKVMLAFGETRYDKGLDILLKALSNVKEPFHLVIAGKPTEITKEDIKYLTVDYKESITLILSFIDDDLMFKLFEMSDIVVLPYRKKFTGASGPLTTAVAYEKMIIGPNANSIGNIINSFHLGNVFECENIDSLSKCISKSLLSEFKYDEFAKKYQNIISKEKFLDSYKQVYLYQGVEL